ncbi:hypothetical protein SAMN05216359_1303 [Roseateles sp. YR242]|nr:hypothetical protein SAMN05216359_1303 [Roseateles sp. YR242]
MVRLDAAQLQHGRTGPRADERCSTQGIAPGHALARLDQAAHGALGHLLAVARAWPARSSQVRAAQVPVLGHTACSTRRRFIAARSRDVGCFGFGGDGRSRPARASGDSRMGLHLASGMRGVAMTHLPMRLQPQHARSRRCQRAGTAGGRNRCSSAARAARTFYGPDALRHPSWAPRPALHTACRRRCAQEATPRCEQRSPWPSFASRLDASSHPGVASCASLRQRRASVAARFLHPNLMRPRGRGPGAWTAPARGRPPQRCGNPPGGRMRLRVSTGAGRCCPLSSRQRLHPIPPPFPGKGASRPLPSAVPGLTTARHRTRRASFSAPPRQGQALTGGRWPAWTR